MARGDFYWHDWHDSVLDRKHLISWATYSNGDVTGDFIWTPNGMWKTQTLQLVALLNQTMKELSKYKRKYGEEV